MTMFFRIRQLLIPGIVFAMALAITLQLWTHEKENVQRAQKATLDFNLRELSSRIEQHLVSYEQIVRGINGLLAQGDQLNRHRFKAYVNSLSLGPNFSGIEGIGYAKIVAASELNSHVKAMRNSGLSAYAINPSGNRETYAPIVQIESSNSRLSKFFGYDPFTSPERYIAMLRAADSGSPSIGRFEKLPSWGDDLKQSDCVLFVPLYRGGATPDTPQGRRIAIVGWAFVVLRMSDLMASLHGERRTDLQVSLHDDVNPSPKSLLFESGTDALSSTTESIEATEYLSIGGATWVLTVRSRSNLSKLDGNDLSRIILVAGVLLSFLLALVCWQMLTAKNYALALAQKITEELRKSEELARHMAQHDSLTSLPNRALFSDRISQAITLARRDKTRLALLYIDLDNFKPINDTYGHSMGDKVLGMVASRLCSAVRESDTVGRIGGDEFVVLLPVIASNVNVQIVTEKILESLNTMMDLDSKSVYVSASIGIATYPENGTNEIDLFKAADAAMYEAKAKHRNCFVWATQGHT